MSALIAGTSAHAQEKPEAAKQIQKENVQTAPEIKASRAEPEVNLKRPDKRNVPGRAPGFHYDENTVPVSAPAKNQDAISAEQPAVDAAPQPEHSSTTTPSPESSVEYPDEASGDGPQLAYYLGECQSADGPTMSIIAYTKAGVLVAIWMVPEDKFPRIGAISGSTEQTVANPAQPVKAGCSALVARVGTSTLYKVCPGCVHILDQ